MGKEKEDKEDTTELMLLLAQITPQEKLVQMLYEKILVYKAEKTEEAIQAVEVGAMLLLTKRTINSGVKEGNEKEGVEKFKTFLEEVREGHELISRLKGTNSDMYNKSQGEGEE